MTKNINQFPKFSSKVKRVNIELPNYKFFHSPSLLEQNDDRFIGRDGIIERLKNILTKNKPNSGAYLVTGYRGMGKSSYVNKVLNQITLKKRSVFFGLYLYLLFFLFIYFIFLFLDLGMDLFFTPKVFATATTFFVFIVDCWLYNNVLVRFFRDSIKVKLMQLKQKEWSDILTFLKPGFSFKHFFSNLKPLIIELFNKRRRVVLKLNLGHEILNEKDIISLIAKNIEKEFRKFAFSFRRQTGFYLLKILVLLFLTSQIIKTDPIPGKFYYTIFPTQKTNFKEEKNFKKEKYTELINQIRPDYLSKIENNPSAAENTTEEKQEAAQSTNIDKSFFNRSKSFLLNAINLADIYCDAAYCYMATETKKLLPIKITEFPTHLNYLFLLIFFLLNFFLTFFVEIILSSNYTPFTSRKVIIRKLKQLNDHIDAAVKTELTSGLSTNESRIGLNINQRRAKEYPMAGIRQMEKSLIDIFDEMNNLVFIILRPEFIIVFDELDKIDPRSNSNISDKEEELTDFDNSANGFTGGATTRLRKQNVLKLLANMKYFITTAKAKFIFISGRELYDAFLADVSDREFSISSIFHEVIYVDSFLSDTSDKNKCKHSVKYVLFS